MGRDAARGVHWESPQRPVWLSLAIIFTNLHCY